MSLLDKYLKKAIEKGFFSTIILILDKLIAKIHIYLVSRCTKVQANKIAFLNFSGNYDCNPKSICDEMIKRKLPVDYVWGVKKNTSIGPMFFPNEVKTVVRNSYQYYKELSTCKIIVDNAINVVDTNYQLKSNQVLIQTWHGSLGIKRFDRNTNKDPVWVRKADIESKATKYIISNSDFEDMVYHDAFWPNTPIWKFGHARNDILFNSDPLFLKAIDDKVRTMYNINDKAKLCMYAPTFRDDGDLSPYTIDYKRLTFALGERFGGDWIVLTRFHAKTRKYIKNYKLPRNVIDVSEYIDIQELMCVVDAGITDYSSWICEYMLRRKPGFIFATDSDKYTESERSLYVPLDKLPFPASYNIDQLLTNILDFDETKYKNDVDKYLKEMGSVDDGNASKRIVNEIVKIMKA